MRIRVECYAGYRGEETPLRIWMGNRKIEIKEIVDFPGPHSRPVSFAKDGLPAETGPWM